MKHENSLFKTQIKKLKNLKDEHFDLNKDLKMFKGGSSKLHMILKHEKLLFDITLRRWYINLSQNKPHYSFD